MKKPPWGGGMCQREAAIQEAEIPTDTFSLAIIGVIAIVAFWLVFSVIRRVLGLVLLAVVAIGAWMLWSNPEMLHNATEAVMGLLS